MRTLLLMVLMLAGCSKSMPCSETSKAALPESLITSGTATTTPLLVLATSSTEPIPACHHCPVAPPKIEKHRRHKKRPEEKWYNPRADSVNPPASTELAQKLWESDCQLFEGKHAVWNAKDKRFTCGNPAMTPQQFTNFMDDNFPAIPARKYPPDYKLPKGEQ